MVVVVSVPALQSRGPGFSSWMSRYQAVSTWMRDSLYTGKPVLLYNETLSIFSVLG